MLVSYSLKQLRWRTRILRNKGSHCLNKATGAITDIFDIVV